MSDRGFQAQTAPAIEALVKGRATRRRVEVLETYFDAAGRPMKRRGLGAARVARRYDESGNKVEEAYFNADGKPTLRKDLGVARIAWSYDERGNPVEAAFFGADGAPIEGAGIGSKRKALLEKA
jgi:YD repeat-containing protein